MVIASDLAWRKARYSDYGGSYVNSTWPILASSLVLSTLTSGAENGMLMAVFYAPGILAGDHNKGLFFYVIANAFLKGFLVILYMSQTFYGLKGGSHFSP